MKKDIKAVYQDEYMANNKKVILEVMLILMIPEYLSQWLI
jgi:hypothetical protein